ncbi:MAG: hypothetical protein ACJAU0_001175 [Flavobacteriales bacterium]
MGRLKKDSETDHNSNSWWKKLGVGAFLFFLIKGLIWIAIAVMTYLGFESC